MPRIAIIQKDRCNPVGCGNYLCIKLCPINRTGKDCIVSGADHKPKIDELLCTGCGICPNRCPFEAINIINLPEELDEEPIHRYGPNQFCLFSLPTPVLGSVVGIIGRNGIGKSTAIKILAGILKPNLGKSGHEAGYDEMLDFFKGTETQNFFEKLKKGEIRVSYKPQHVEMLAGTKGLVGELLKKVDQRNKFAEIVGRLELGHLLNREMPQLSGGELQRVAIAAAALKDANLYIIDEPTSFLDIKQRLKIAGFIKELANENTAVMVIEHDLVALDYMADIVNIMYGKEECYGIVSQPKSARQGINSYLEGYLKDENVRFREYRIKFEIKPSIDAKKAVSLVEWGNIRKSLGNFTLEVKPGKVMKHEVVGVVGENGIGKTTFAKILAGVVQADEGVPKKVVISYKPQYLDNTSEESVENVLREALTSYQNEIIKPLQLKGLITKKINQLSGGELQRVAIAIALSKDCDMVLLDEPSAYLDIEQRLLVARIIDNLAHLKGYSVLVVDHDLVFIDYLSNRLLVFQGMPAVHGIADGPFGMEEGMNKLLSHLGITLRREELSGRPRINKPGSQKDRQQKESKKHYYA
ncbi:MAG: ribosome biogenesis/translation initiation ATPase RLI [Candidatus Woesearchaeota archaeon]